ncbi:MAG TPA: hypothetical protein VME18_05350 [Acidobacteriaceae bacterium]|nr:hypothetical protein [Acidobacteriaceae bacterium]
MGRWALLFGLILLLLGIFDYMGGNHASAALTPAYFGILLGVLGATARTDKEKTRMIAMHIAAAVGLVGFLWTVGSLWDYVQMQRGLLTPAHPRILQEHALTSGILLFFVLLCVLSFIRARRARQAVPASTAAGSRQAR